MNSAWWKIVGFVLVVVMLAGLASMLLDPGLGKPSDESRRVAHAAGFSVVGPRGWTTEFSLASPGERNAESMIVSEPSRMGIPTSFEIRRLPPGATSAADVAAEARPTTFQGQPARAVEQQKRKRVVWTMSFDRPDEDGARYEVVVTSPYRLDYDNGPLRGFIDTFRASTVRVATTGPTPGPTPGTVPSTQAR